MTVLRAAAYCRISTDKDEQLSSLENQKSFFEDYVHRIWIRYGCDSRVF